MKQKSHFNIGLIGMAILALGAVAVIDLLSLEAIPTEEIAVQEEKRKRKPLHKMSLVELKDELKRVVRIEDFVEAIRIRNLIELKTGEPQIKND